MIAGSKEQFAIEAEPQTFDLSWILGRFRFWVCGHEVGDWDDCTALQYCFARLRAFTQEPTDRIMPSIAHSDPIEVFRHVVNPVFGPAGIADPRKQPIPFAYERFHITHLGMSSFDAYVVVLVKDADGAERCLWRKNGEEKIYDCWLAAGEMERVAAEFCNEFEKTYLNKTNEEK